MSTRKTSRRWSPGASFALDVGLRVRVESSPRQGCIFSGAENLSARQLTSELAELVSGLRVHSFSLRHALERTMSALMINVECGFWKLARNAALDLALLLTDAKAFAHPELCSRGCRCAQRIAALCGEERR
jgi:hypothetical protein